MNQERDLGTLKEFYKTERLPKLIIKLEQIYREKKTDFVPKLLDIIEEVNQAIDFIHGDNADHMPHYRLTEIDGNWIRSQYIPDFEKTEPNSDKKAETFESGPAQGMLKPRVIKEASYENAPDFDLQFLNPAFEELDTYLSNPIKPNTTSTEIVIYEAGAAGGFEDQGSTEDTADLDEIDEMLTVIHNTLDNPDSYLEDGEYEAYDDEDGENAYYLEYGDTDDDEYEDEYFGDDELDDEYEDEYFGDDELDGSNIEMNPGELHIFFEKEIEPGMFMLEVQAADGDGVETLYLPHIPLNFPMVHGIVQGYREAGGIAVLTFSAADRDSNLILPIDPKSPHTPTDPLLN